MTMDNMNATSVLTLMPAGKDGIKKFSAKAIQELKNGTIDPLYMLAQLKYIEKTIKIITDDEEVREIFLNALYGDKRLEAHGCVFEEAEAGAKYDFSRSQDWLEADAKVIEATEHRKTIEKRLKTASLKTPYLDISTGEEITGIPKESKTIVKTTIK